MRINAKSYPHPVLGNEDDISGSFKVDFNYELGRENVVLGVTFILDNVSIEKLIKSNKASYIVEVECRSTFFRTSLPSSSSIARYEIPARMLRERVTVGFYVCSATTISDYRPEGAHSDYGKAVFTIDPGDVLAAGAYSTFIAEKAFDPLRPPVSSFMSVVEDGRQQGPMEIDYELPKITINLSKEDYKNYKSLRGQHATVGVLHGAVAFPVLVDAIYKVQHEADEYEEKNWYGRLSTILEARSLLGKEPFEAAQIILANPATRSFLGVNSLLDVNGEQDL